MSSDEESDGLEEYEIGWFSSITPGLGPLTVSRRVESIEEAKVTKEGGQKLWVRIRLVLFLIYGADYHTRNFESG
jgi:hypothetical protein